jgi:arabinofuranosyltransferase
LPTVYELPDDVGHEPRGPVTERDWRRLVSLVTLSVLSTLVIRAAWVSDDAYITFRTIDNFFHGYGLRWNIAERVQTYTHPLWMLVVAAAYSVTHEPYYTSIALSLLLTLSTVYLLVNKVATSLPSSVAAVIALLMSKAFIDYSTSGLENALTHWLLIAFFSVHFGDSNGRRRVLVLTAVTALLATNHADTVLLVAPVLLITLWRERGRATLVAFLIGLTPIVAWEAFSLIYYGFPLPNTAYAKLLRTGVPASALLMQGLIYLFDSIRLDPVTLMTIAGASAFVIATRMMEGMPVVVGMFLYLIWVVRIGGDFMSGRLLSAPLICAAVILGRVNTDRIDRRMGALVYAGLIAVGLASPRPTVLNNPSTTTEAGSASLIAPSGIADERLVYFQETGLLNVTRATGPAGGRVKNPAPEGLSMGSPLSVEHLAQVGFHGYYAGPAVHVIDHLGLGDPLLARLPSTGSWRIGHFYRGLPDGYQETIATGVNHLKDPGLIAYYNRLLTITRGDIFSRDRFRTIVRMNLGQYDSLLTPAPY